MMNYKGYISKVTLDEDENIFHGEVMNLRDVITFQGSSIEELRQAMKDSIEDYLSFCSERSENPEKPFSGNFPLRSTPEEHRMFCLAAARANKSLNAWVIETLRKATA